MKAFKGSDKRLEENGRDHSEYNNKALLLSQMGKSEEAVRNFKRAIDIAEDLPRRKKLKESLSLYRNNIGRELIKIGRYSEAKKYLKKNGKNNAESKFLLGHAYDNMGKYVSAMNSYKRALVLDDSYTIPMNDHRHEQVNASKKKASIIMFSLVIILLFGLYIASSFLSKQSKPSSEENLESKPEEIITDLTNDEDEETVDENEQTILEEVTEDTNNKIVYRIIVDTFSVKSNAEKQLNELRDQGIDAVILNTNLDGQEYHKVMAGSYASKKNAISQFKNLKNRGYNPIISEAEVLR